MGVGVLLTWCALDLIAAVVREVCRDNCEGRALGCCLCSAAVMKSSGATKQQCRAGRVCVAHVYASNDAECVYEQRCSPSVYTYQMFQRAGP